MKVQSFNLRWVDPTKPELGVLMSFDRNGLFSINGEKEVKYIIGSDPYEIEIIPTSIEDTKVPYDKFPKGFIESVLKINKK